MKFFLKQVGNTVFFKVIEADYEANEDPVTDHVDFSVGNIHIRVGDNMTHMYRNNVYVSDSRHVAIGVALATFVEFITNGEAEEFANQMENICQEIVKRFCNREPQMLVDGDIYTV
jgi:hypothetical protein